MLSAKMAQLNCVCLVFAKYRLEAGMVDAENWQWVQDGVVECEG